MPIRKESITRYIVFSDGIDLITVHEEKAGAVTITTTGQGVLTSTIELEQLGRDLITIKNAIGPAT